MKKNQWFLLLPALVLTFCITAFPQKDKNLDKYKSRTLAEIPLVNRDVTNKILRKAKPEEKADFISYDLLYSRVKVEFTAQQRAISPDHQDLINLWSKLQKVDKKITSLYENEFLFREGKREFWIPVQKTVEEVMLREVKPNDEITLFVAHVGGRKAPMAKDFDWLFLSTEFAK